MIKDIIIVGKLPPPTGGISVHVEQLSHLLMKTGATVRVLDYGRPSSVVSGLWFLLKHITRVRLPRSDVPVIHVHASAVRRLLVMTPLLILLAKVFPVVLTIHSGSFATRISSLDHRGQKRFRRLLQSIHAIVAVSEDIALAISGQFPDLENGITVVSPFIPDELLYNARSSKCKQDGYLVASGYGIPLYGWLELVRTAMLLDQIRRVDLIMYNTFDENYLESVMQCIGDDRRFFVHRDITRAKFLGLLSSAQIFVRPTKSDGDSIAVREAIMLDCEVVASDSAERPEICRVYETGNSADLTSKIALALCGSKRVSQRTFGPKGEPIENAFLTVYREATANFRR